MKYKLLLLICVITFTICGCSKNSKELQFYKSNLDTVCVNVEKINDAINEIDTSSENATVELLEYLDMLDAVFKEMASLDVPSEINSINDLAQSISTDMSLAVSMYHEAYDNEYNDVKEANAYEYYVKANREFQGLLAYLRGDDLIESASDAESFDNIENVSDSINENERIEDDYSEYLEDEYEDYYEAYKDENVDEEVNSDSEN